MYEPLQIHLDTPVEEASNLAAKFNQQVAALEQCEAERLHLASNAMEHLSASDLTANDLRKLRLRIEGDAFDLTRRALDLIEQREAVLGQIIERLQTQVDETSAVLGKIRKSVAKALAGQGLIPDTPHLPARAAQQQLDSLVDRSQKVRTARVNWDRARSQVVSAQEQKKTCIELRERASLDLRAAGRKLLGLSTRAKRPTGTKAVTELIV